MKVLNYTEKDLDLKAFKAIEKALNYVNQNIKQYHIDGNFYERYIAYGFEIELSINKYEYIDGERIEKIAVWIA